MDIDDLRTFVEVADAGGVTPAARRLGVSKSMVSRRLVRLEAELSVQLLARSTRGASLTEAGATFRDHAARVVADIDAARETILPAGELRGRLRIAAPLSFGPTHFASVLAEVAKRHPELQVHASYTDRFVDLIAEGFDCAIRVGKLTDSNLIARKIGPLHAKYVATPAYIEKHGSPETPEELVKHEALMQGTETWPALDGDRVIAIRPRGRFKADNGAALVAAALAGIGVAILPVKLIQEHLDSGALVEVMPRYPVPALGIYVVRPPGLPSRKIRVLIEMLIECFGHHSEEAKTAQA
ncbi:LysR family transcriptional regulator [Inquilinus sp. Marseille-Q2685]|uniref:LysR family transcriptional regulator n=1 Tax=Inquilinus sp. Marseille-Q2685 TaxID=2866581 RepID=UPI001CE48794|nr:LysR family transcriptional regulator [Inquilinus sp. Marseille-Q2685]